MLLKIQQHWTHHISWLEVDQCVGSALGGGGAAGHHLPLASPWVDRQHRGEGGRGGGGGGGLEGRVQLVHAALHHLKEEF